MRRSSHRTSQLAVASMSTASVRQTPFATASLSYAHHSSTTTATPPSLVLPSHIQLRNCATTTTIPPIPPPSTPNDIDVGDVVDIDTYPITGVYGTCLFGLETLLADYTAVSSEAGGVKRITVYTTLVPKSVVEKSASADAKRSSKGNLLDASARRKAFKSSSSTTSGNVANIKGGKGVVATATDPTSMPSPDQPPTSRTISSKAPLGDTIRVFTLHSNGVVLDGKRFPVVPAYTFQPTLRYPTLEPPKLSTPTKAASTTPTTEAITSKTVGPRVLSPGTKHAEVVVFEAVEYHYEDSIPEGDAADTVGVTKAVHSVGVFAEGSVVGFGLPDDAIQSLLSLVLHPYADPKDAMLVPKPSTVRMHNLVYRVPTAPPPSPHAHEFGVVGAHNNTPSSSMFDGDDEKEPSSHVLRSAPALLVKSPLSGIPSTALSDSGLWGLARRVLRERREEAASAAADAGTTVKASSQDALHGRKKDRTFHYPGTLATPAYIVPHLLSTSHIVVRSRFAMLPSLPKNVISFLHGKRQASSPDGLDVSVTEPSSSSGGVSPTTPMTSEEEAAVRSASTITTYTRPHSVLLTNSDPMSALPYMFGIHEVVLLRGYNALVLPIRSKVAAWQHHVSRTGALPMSLKEARVLKASLLRISSRQAKIANTRHKILWEERHVLARQQFLATGDHFEMGAASEELKHRNEVLQSSVAYLCDQAHQEKDYYLEYIIILLIMVEVYLAMESHGLGLWDDEEGGEGTFGGGGHHPRQHPAAITSTSSPLVVEQPLIPSLRCHGSAEGEGGVHPPPQPLPELPTTSTSHNATLPPPTSTPSPVVDIAESSEPIQANTNSSLYVSSGQYTVDMVCASVLGAVAINDNDNGTGPEVKVAVVESDDEVVVEK